MIALRFTLLRMRSFFNPERIGFKWIFEMLTFLSILLFGYVMSLVGNMILAGAAEDISFQVFTEGILRVLFAFTFFRMFVPVYAPMHPVFEKYHPVSVFQKYMIGLLSDFLRPYFLFVLTFVAVFSFILSVNHWDFFTMAVSMVMTAHLLRRYIQYIIDYRLSKIGIISWIAIFIGVTLIFLSGYLTEDGVYQSVKLFAPVILFLSGFWLEKNILSEKAHNTILLFDGRYLLKLLFCRAKSRAVILLAFFTKAFLLFAVYSSFQETGELLQESNFIFYVVFSPLAIFTYAFNNTWAFWGDLWARAQLAGGFKEVRNQQLRLMALPLLTDMFITSTFIFLVSVNPLAFLSIYLGSTISLIPLSVVWSLVKPKKVKTVFQMGPVASFAGNIVTFLVILLMALVTFNWWWSLMIPVLFIASLAGYYYVYKNYEVYKEKLLRIVE